MDNWTYSLLYKPKSFLCFSECLMVYKGNTWRFPSFKKDNGFWHSLANMSEHQIQFICIAHKAKRLVTATTQRLNNFPSMYNCSTTLPCFKLSLSIEVLCPQFALWSLKLCSARFQFEFRIIYAERTFFVVLCMSGQLGLPCLSHLLSSDGSKIKK